MLSRWRARCLALYVRRHTGSVGGSRPCGRLSIFIWTSFVIDGAVWGLAGIWGAGARSETVALLVACISSVAMLATFALQIQFKATMAYVAPMLCPMALALLARGDTLGLFAAGGTILVLVQTVVTSIASQRRATQEYLANEQLKEALEEVKRQSSVKTLFLGSMSHELRTTVARDPRSDRVDPAPDDGNEHVSRHLKLIRSSGEHLLELISALLDVSRIDAGKLELHPIAVDLALELRAIADVYAVRASAKGLAFEVDLKLGQACWVKADLTRTAPGAAQPARQCDEVHQARSDHLQGLGACRLDHVRSPRHGAWHRSQGPAAHLRRVPADRDDAPRARLKAPDWA